MAYRFKLKETVPDGIRRIVDEEIQSASEQLGNGNRKKRDDAIHEARKSLKKVRGVLRLVQPELGRVYTAENTRMRNVGRQLSEIRDATAIMEVFDGLLQKYDGKLQKDTFSAIRRGLEKSKRETEQTANVDRVQQRALATLRATGRRVKTWPLSNDGFEAIAGGLERRYRRGRRAMATARKDPTPENYHEWRKRVKDHWYHVRLLENLWTDVMRAREASLKELETWLGDDHNLVVLRGKLEGEPEKYGEPENLQLFFALMDRYQNELRDKSFALGERVYEEKPRQFARNLSKLWDAWQNEPDSATAGKKAQPQKSQAGPARKQPGRASAAAAKSAAVA